MNGRTKKLLLSCFVLVTVGSGAEAASATAPGITVSAVTPDSSLVRGQHFRGRFTVRVEDKDVCKAAGTAWETGTGGSNRCQWAQTAPNHIRDELSKGTGGSIAATAGNVWGTGGGAITCALNASDARLIDCVIRGVLAQDKTVNDFIASPALTVTTTHLSDISGNAMASVTDGVRVTSAGNINVLAGNPAPALVSSSLLRGLNGGTNIQGGGARVFAICEAGASEYNGIARATVADGAKNGCAGRAVGDTSRVPMPHNADSPVRFGAYAGNTAQQPSAFAIVWPPAARPGAGLAFEGSHVTYFPEHNSPASDVYDAAALAERTEEIVSNWTNTTQGRRILMYFRPAAANVTSVPSVSSATAHADFQIVFRHNGSDSDVPDWVRDLTVALVPAGGTVENSEQLSSVFGRNFRRYVATANGQSGTSGRTFSFGDVEDVSTWEIWIDGRRTGAVVGNAGNASLNSCRVANSNAECPRTVNLAALRVSFADSVEAVARMGGSRLTVSINAGDFWTGGEETPSGEPNASAQITAVLEPDNTNGSTFGITVGGYEREGCGVFRANISAGQNNTAVDAITFPANECNSSGGLTAPVKFFKSGAARHQNVTIGLGNTLDANTALLPEIAQIIADAVRWQDISGPLNIWGPEIIRRNLVDLGSLRANNISALCATAACNGIAGSRAGAGRALWVALGSLATNPIGSVGLEFDFVETSPSSGWTAHIDAVNGAVTRSADRHVSGTITVTAAALGRTSKNRNEIAVTVAQQDEMGARLTAPAGALQEIGVRNVVWVSGAASTNLSQFRVSGIGICTTAARLADPACVTNPTAVVRWYSSEQYLGGTNFEGVPLNSNLIIQRDTILIAEVTPSGSSIGHYIEAPFLYVVEFKAVPTGQMVFREQPSVPAAQRFFEGFISTSIPAANRTLAATVTIGLPTSPAPNYRWFKLDNPSADITWENIREFGTEIPGQSGAGSLSYALPTGGAAQLTAGEHYFALRAIRGSAAADTFGMVSDIVTVNVERWVPATSITFSETEIDLAGLQIQGAGANRAAIFPLVAAVNPDNASMNEIVWSILPSNTTANVQFNANSTALLVRSPGTVNLQGEIVRARGNNPHSASTLTQAVLLTFEGSVGVAETARDVPVVDEPADIAAAAPVERRVTLTAGPNPAPRGTGMSFFSSDDAVVGGTLRIFDASGSLVRSLAVSSPNANNAVATWDLKDARGRAVSEGTYLVRGALTTVTGRRAAVTALVGISR